MSHYFVFDVESVGLHGEGFAVGWVVVSTEQERPIEAARLACPVEQSAGDDAGRLWLRENCPRFVATHTTPEEMRADFWKAWRAWVRTHNARMVADCAWPVEARFLLDCIADNPRERQWNGPYPLLDLSGILIARGLDPVGRYERQSSDELPEHDPLADARQTARLFLKYLNS